MKWLYKSRHLVSCIVPLVWWPKIIFFRLHSTNSTINTANINRFALLWRSWKAVLDTWRKGDVERETDRDYLQPSPPGPGGRGNTIALRGLLSCISLRHLIKIVLYYNTSHRFSSVHTKLGLIIIKTGGDQSLDCLKSAQMHLELRAGDVCKGAHRWVCFALFVSEGLFGVVLAG